MKARTLLISVAFIVLLVIIGYLIHVRAKGVAPAGGNPPVVIVGGSLYGNSPQGWTEVTKKNVYRVQTQNSDLIYTNAVYSNNNLVTQPVAAAGAWVLKIFDRDAQGKPQGLPGVTVCTSQNCLAKDNTNLIWVASRNDSNSFLVPDSSGMVAHFYSTIAGCDSKPSGKQSDCDVIDHMEFDDLNAHTTTTWNCGTGNNAGSCALGIGAPLPVSSTSQ